MCRQQDEDETRIQAGLSSSRLGQGPAVLGEDRTRAYKLQPGDEDTVSEARIKLAYKLLHISRVG